MVAETHVGNAPVTLGGWGLALCWRLMASRSSMAYIMCFLCFQSQGLPNSRLSGFSLLQCLISFPTSVSSLPFPGLSCCRRGHASPASTLGRDLRYGETLPYTDCYLVINLPYCCTPGSGHRGHALIREMATLSGSGQQGALQRV